MQISSQLFRWRVGLTGALALSLCMCEKPPAVTAGGGGQSSETPEPPKAEEKPGLFPIQLPSFNKVEIPVDRILTDDQGRSLDATIVGKSAEAVQIIRKSDGLNAEIPIAKLAEKDRQFVDGLDMAAPPADFAVGRTREAASKKESNPYVQNRLDEIARLQEENIKLQIEADSSTNSMVVKNRLNTIEKNEQEIEKLRTAIHLHQNSK